MINNIDKDPKRADYCTGCQICGAVCPNNAIIIRIDDEGFYRPHINIELCIHCGSCVRNCYKYDDDILLTTSDKSICVYSAFSKNEEILLKSSSGGVSSHLINECLNQGYNVVGVTYDYNCDVAVSEIANNLEQARHFKGSKYMQAYTLKTFKHIIEGDISQKYAVFGTPCHIYALNEWSIHKGCREKFLFIDIFCHGCPSIFLWQKYVEDIKEKVKAKEFDKIEFRSKSRGWHEYCHSFYKGDTSFTSGNTIDDPFFTLFFDNQILCRSCYNCKLRSTLEYTDIRLGDFWGEDYDLNTKGVSGVVVCTQKGRLLFEEIKPFIEAKMTTLDRLVKGQSYGRNYSYNSIIRSTTIELLKSRNSMSLITKEYLRTYSFRKKIKSKMKKIMYILPISTRNQIKKIYHALVRKNKY